MFQTLSLKYYCGNYYMEILQFFIKIGITSHQWVLIKEFIWLIIINNEKNSLTFLSFT